MLLLCSNGLSSETLLSHISSKMIDCKTAALVVTADSEYKENNYHVPRCVLELKALNLMVDIFDLDKQSADLLLKYDVVEFIGGNPFYLLHSIRENKAIEILRDIAANKILIGWSAAAFVFGPTLELVNCYSPEMNFLGLTDLNGLSLTKVQVLPHYSTFLTRFERFEEKCSTYEKAQNVNVIRINDGDGVFIDSEVHICKTDMISLVQAQAEDAPLAQAMQQEAFAELLERYRDYDMSPATEALEKIRWKITHPGSYYYFIQVGDQAVGAIRVLDLKDGSRKRISPLYIMPAYRGKGYAQAAMAEAERIHGANHWQLDTILQEAGNCYLYEKMGYHRTGHQAIIQENMTIVDYEKD